MSYCLNPDCGHPQNREGSDRVSHSRAQVCRSCGQVILLKQRYRPIRSLGQGGFGRTFIGVDLDLPKSPRCVIKQLFFQTTSAALQAKAIALFEQEALQLSQLGSHPQIPTLAAYFKERDQLYLVQEWVNGQPLNPSVWSQHPNLEPRIWQLLRDLLPVLQFIHDRNVIHRDIKPDNILQRRSDGKFILIDFGIARTLTETAMMGGATVIGTPGFMAPEQMRGKVLPASDLYSLGVTCLNLITGLHPDTLFDVVNDRWQWRDRLPPGQTLSPALIRILNSLIAPSLRQRVQSATALLRDIGGPTVPPIRSDATPSPDLNTPTIFTGTRAAEDLTPTTQTPPPADPQPVRIDYTHLKTMLQKRRWEQADAETWAILCRLLRKRDNACLFVREIAALPCADLQAIDFLWAKYSDRHFGFKIQSQLFITAKADYPAFCQQVGWPVHRVTRHTYLQFTHRAPQGHLPSRRWVGGTQWWKHAEQLTQKLQACDLL
ncbi:protein kinase domain-containing protein [Spirulina major]|uniref:protein kinase domain-containing protein n=1 Tax=Spirulina major TaxID=270636 RepID=UPI0009338B79|nr:serine/threonine-protein kinase [Spirulina major]